MLIDRRLFLQQLVAASGSIAARAHGSETESVPSRKPNIVIILSDDVGCGDLSCYGATQVHTPQLDALAAHGLRFTNAHAAAATCTEGGTTIPFIVRWTGHIKPNISNALISQVDLLSSLAFFTHQPVPQGTAKDSVNVLPALLGRSPTGRQYLVDEAAVLAIREGNWKLIDRSQKLGLRTVPELGTAKAARPSPGSAKGLYPTAPLELYNIKADPYETRNIAPDYSAVVKRLQEKLAEIRKQGHS
jgi:arylsulfatase A-like enzyme